MIKQKLDTYLTNYTRKNKIPALFVSVIGKNNPIYENGLGTIDINRTIPTTKQSIFKWWSITKMVTAIAIMQLAEKGKLNIESPVRDYIKFFELAGTGSNEIKIKHLLNHSSGLKDNMPEIVGWMHFENKVYTEQSKLLQDNFHRYKKLLSKPGQFASYTNVGYMLLGEIIKAVSGQTYESYVLENIISPLGMDNTNFYITDTMASNMVTGTHPLFSIETAALPFFYKDLGSLLKVKNNLLWFNTFFPMATPPSGLIGPAIDFYPFISMLLHNGRYKNTQIIQENTLKQMIHSDQMYQKGHKKEIKFGYGLRVTGNDENYCYYHDGLGVGFSSTMRIYPNKEVGILLLANTMTLDLAGLSKGIFQQLNI